MKADYTALVPTDLGLPKSFAHFRKGQDEVAFKLAQGDKRFKFLDAPTGTGKSLTCLAAAKILGARTLILTATKGLQAQYTADFAPIGMRDIRGQSNYQCRALDKKGDLSKYGKIGGNCDEGPCHVGVYCGYKFEGGCLYYDAQTQAKSADIVITNYAYWMTLGRHSDPDALGEFDLLVLDEAHAAPFLLADFCTVSIDRQEIRFLLELELPDIDEGVAVWAEWARGAHKIARDRYVARRKDLEKQGSDKRQTTHALLRLQSLVWELAELSRANQWRNSEGPRKDVRVPGSQTDWLAEHTEHGIKFSPIWAHAYAETFLFRAIPNIILTSATLTPATARYLGINLKNSDWVTVPSNFSPARRPFIFIPTTPVGRNMNEGQLRMWMNRIDNIIDSRRDRKGIIHTRSYDRARTILERSRHKAIFLTHNSRNSRAVIAQFKRSDAPCILVSPSVEEGFDFPYDECQFQIITKIPFVDPNGTLTKARVKTDKNYLNDIAALDLVQTAGRGMRFADDMCETFLIDDNWRWFSRSTRFPTWFKAAWRVRDSIPPPLAPVTRPKS